VPTPPSTQVEFEELIGPLLDGLFGYSLRMAQNRADAEDLLQESVYRAYRGFEGFRRGTNFKAWMFRIVTNTFISRVRSAKRAPMLLAELDSIEDTATALQEELIDAETDWQRVIGDHVEDEVKLALSELPAEFRAPLLLSCLGGLRYKEIASALDVPIGTVMSRLFRARQRMRRSLRSYAEERGLPLEETRR
jgi:RNA polymerase sigma-70 factor (ECF subfamily)